MKVSISNHRVRLIFPFSPQIQNHSQLRSRDSKVPWFGSCPWFFVPALRRRDRTCRWNEWEWLSTQIELFDNRLVPLEVCFFEIMQKFSPSRCHHEQASARVKVFAMSFEMFRKVWYAGGEQCNLYVARARILFVGTIVFDDVCFVYLFSHFI